MPKIHYTRFPITAISSELNVRTSRWPLATAGLVCIVVYVGNANQNRNKNDIICPPVLTIYSATIII